MENINQENIHQTGVIISLSREIETAMTKLGATGAGLHDKTDFLSSKLTPECIKLLHFIAAVRNRNAHETTSMSQEDMELFVQSCSSVLEELKSLAPQETVKSEPLSEKDILQKSASDDFDENFMAQIDKVWKVLAWIPFVHVLYLFGGILKTLKNSAIYILLVLFYFSGIILIGTGIKDKNSFFWGSGIFVFVLVWGYALILRLLDKECRLHKNFCLIPFLNIVYLCYMIRKKTPLMHFFIYVIMLAVFFLGGSFLYKENFGTVGLILLGCTYIGSAIDSLLFNKKTVTK